MITYSIIIVAGTGLILGVLIALAAKFFSIEQDPKISELSAILPGVNCGACGFAGCADFAKALVEERATPDMCPVSSPSVRFLAAKALDAAYIEPVKKIAVVFCGGNNLHAKTSARYNGVSDCRSANLIAGGGKVCGYGCLGLGACARACPFGAIEIIAGLAVIHPELCVACGKCIKTCPRTLIKLVPASVHVHVFCSSSDKPADKRKYCDVSCIACRKCVKAAGENQMTADGFLVKTNYENPPPNDLVEKAACPTKSLSNTYPSSYLSAKIAIE
jgi:Na+-translocating ferredoxin:NAD+ oxidoreductase RNF subunit RnfB